MQLAFAMSAWAGVGPGLNHQNDWKAWLTQPSLPQGEVALDVSHIPAMARRRLGHLAKMAVSVADAVLPHASQPDIPVVWASRYGDADKSLALLRTQVQGQEPLSPTAFGLSVHNGIGAQHSILRGMKANAICVASSHCAPEAAVVEALGLLHEGAPEVLCVVYDTPLPAAYAQFHDEAVIDIAWAVLLTKPQPGHPCFELQAESLEGQPSPAQDGVRLPHALEVFRFLIDPELAVLRKQHPGGIWTWRRVHA